MFGLYLELVLQLWGPDPKFLSLNSCVKMVQIRKNNYNFSMQFLKSFLSFFIFFLRYQGKWYAKTQQVVFHPNHYQIKILIPAHNSKFHSCINQRLLITDGQNSNEMLIFPIWPLVILPWHFKSNEDFITKFE